MSLTFPAYPPHPLSAGEVQAFYEDLSGRQYVNEVFNFSVDKLYDLLFTDSPFQRDFMEQRRFSGLSASPGWCPHPFPLCLCCFPLFPSDVPSFSRPPGGPGCPLWLHAFLELPGPCQLLLPTPLWLYLSSAPGPSVSDPKGSAANRTPQGSPPSREKQPPCPGWHMPSTGHVNLYCLIQSYSLPWVLVLWLP